MRIFALILTICAAASSGRAVRAETIVLGPTPYLSAADSPFDLSGLGTTFFLEDFEDSPGQPESPFTTPGIRETNRSVLFGPTAPPFPFGASDSVDADDGLIDGHGWAGRSLLGGIGFISGSTVTDVITLEFDRASLGGLPSEFGFVLTDTGTGGFFTFEALDAAGERVGGVQGPFVGDGEILGATEEDRFFGITHTHGIASAIIALNGPLDELIRLEIDHVQYGAIVPEPSGVLLFGVGLVVMLGVRWRGRRRRGLAPFCALVNASGLCGETDDTNPKRQRGKCAHEERGTGTSRRARLELSPYKCSEPVPCSAFTKRGTGTSPRYHSEQLAGACSEPVPVLDSQQSVTTEGIES